MKVRNRNLIPTPQNHSESSPEGDAITCFIHSNHPLAFHTIEQVICSDQNLQNCIKPYSMSIKPSAERSRELLILDICSVEGWQETLQEWHMEGGRTIGLISPGQQSDALELEMIYLGVMGVLAFLDNVIQELPKAIYAVLQGSLWIRRDVLGEYVRRTNLLLERFSSRDSRFTVREHQIVELLRQGCSNKQIATRLGISERTAKFHVSNVLKKCDVDNRRDLLAINFRTPPASAMPDLAINPAECALPKGVSGRAVSRRCPPVLSRAAI